MAFLDKGDFHAVKNVFGKIRSFIFSDEFQFGCNVCIPVALRSDMVLRLLLGHGASHGADKPDFPSPRQRAPRAEGMSGVTGPRMSCLQAVAAARVHTALGSHWTDTFGHKSSPSAQCDLGLAVKEGFVDRAHLPL